MATFLVSKAVYLSVQVEAESEEQALEVADAIDWQEWNWNDQDAPEAVDLAFD